MREGGRGSGREHTCLHGRPCVEAAGADCHIGGDTAGAEGVIGGWDGAGGGQAALGGATRSLALGLLLLASNVRLCWSWSLQLPAGRGPTHQKQEAEGDELHGGRHGRAESDGADK